MYHICYNQAISTKLKTTIIIIVHAAFFLGLFVAFFISNRANPRARLVETRGNNYRYINPLLECDMANFKIDSHLAEMQTKLTDQIDKISADPNISSVALYYRDLNNGPWIGINDSTLFSPASLIKVPLLITYLKIAESNPAIMNDTLRLTTPQSGPVQDILPEVTIVPNRDYTVKELINNMIVYSDNNAYDLLINHIDNQLLINTYTDLGINLDKAFKDPDGNILSVKDYASFYRILYNSSYLTKSSSEAALELLSHTKFGKGLITHLPSSVTVSHKYGERIYESTQEKQLHDCGIIYHPSHPYLLCIMTRGKNFSQLENAIQDLSSTVYQEILAN